MAWLIREETARELAAARRGGLAPASEAEALHVEREREARERGPRSLAIAGDIAEVRVTGVLTKRPSLFALYYGGGNTTYPDLLEALAIAKSDPAVKSVRLFVDSPGGQVDGLFDVLAALEDVKGSKPISVYAENAFSAAYGIAAMAGPITAANAASMFGSVGVAASFILWDDVVDLTNTDSPDKRPDLSTEEGKAVIVRELDAIFGLFAEAIARGRGTTVKDVTENFGRGASFVAGDAKKRKMIDAIAKPKLRALASGTGAEAAPPNARKRTMTLEELRAQHPNVYQEAVQQGVTQERDRVVAHLTMGETSGDMKTAAQAIRSGDSMTQTLMATYMAAGMNRGDRKARQEEANAAGVIADGADAGKPGAGAGAGAGGAGGGDLGDKVATILEQRAGIAPDAPKKAAS